MNTIDHITYRVTFSTTVGMLVGASYSTLQALPLPKTTVSMASSFALASTACFIPERMFYHASFYLVPKIQLEPVKMSDDKKVDLVSESSGSFFNERMRLYTSHGLGGIVGGSVSGGLFKGRPIQGLMLLTPMMLGAAYGEMKLQDYKKKRLAELKTEVKR